jgi:anti-anti-sigma factor
VNAQYDERDGVLIVTPIERLDTGNAPAVELEVMRRIEAGASKIVFDFERTNYVSSAGLRVLLKAAKSLNRRDAGVAVCRANSHVREVLDLSGFGKVVKVAKTVSKAIAAL